jgi:hypothetical protein
LPPRSSVIKFSHSISLEIFALFMLTGIFSTMLLPETKGKSLEELSNETQDGFLKGQATFGTVDTILIVMCFRCRGAGGCARWHRCGQGRAYLNFLPMFLALQGFLYLCVTSAPYGETECNLHMNVIYMSSSTETITTLLSAIVVGGFLRRPCCQLIVTGSDLFCGQCSIQRRKQCETMLT